MTEEAQTIAAEDVATVEVGPSISPAPHPDATPEEIVGVANGTLVGDETIVYDYDEAGTFIGWHKTPADVTAPAAEGTPA